jgi:hypothetical protein
MRVGGSAREGRLLAKGPPGALLCVSKKRASGLASTRPVQDNSTAARENEQVVYRLSKGGEEDQACRVIWTVFEKGVADGRKPSGPGRPRYTGGLAPYRYAKFKNALA